MAVRYEKVGPDPKECQLPPRSSSQLYEGPEPEGAFEMFALSVTASSTRGLGGLAVMETCKGGVAPCTEADGTGNWANRTTSTRATDAVRTIPVFKLFTLIVIGFRYPCR